MPFATLHWLTVPRSSFVLRLAAVLALLMAGGDALLHAQLTNPIASRWANARIRGEEIRFLLAAQQIDAAEAQRRTAAMNAELQGIRTLLNALPKQVQDAVAQDTERLFAARVIPLREQWKQQLAEKQRADAVRDAERRKELLADADVAGKLQADRTLLRERARAARFSRPT